MHGDVPRSHRDGKCRSGDFIRTNISSTNTFPKRKEAPDEVPCRVGVQVKTLAKEPDGAPSDQMVDSDAVTPAAESQASGMKAVIPLPSSAVTSRTTPSCSRDGDDS